MAKKKKYEKIDTTFMIDDDDDDDQNSFESEGENFDDNNPGQDELEMSIMWKKKKEHADDSDDENMEGGDHTKDSDNHGLILSNSDDEFEDEPKLRTLNFKDKPASCRQYVIAYWLASIGSALMLCFLLLYQTEEEEEVDENNESLWGNTISTAMFALPLNSSFPTALLKRNGGVYSIETDFKNANGNIPTYWQTLYNSLRSTRNDTNVEKEDKEIPHWGPCYAPIRHVKAPPIRWDKSISKFSNSSNSSNLVYMPYHYKKHQNKDITIGREVANLCRPGFLIIGAGKCGTSSLYQYLIGHPRVSPAKKKQIHYFKYYYDRPMGWYLSHFPNTRSFLGSGSLMTGEASPGYMPYDEVPHRIIKSMNRIATKDQNNYLYSPASIDESYLPKIITIVRNPLSRAWSSYNYNYVQPANEYLQNKTNTEDLLFSFQELVEAELKNLKDCLKENGKAHLAAVEKSKKRPWMKGALQERHRKGINAPMLDLENTCYMTSNEENSNKKQPAQWDDLIEKNPDKILMELADKHVIRSIVGRGLYAIALDWWFASFPSDGIYVICSEDLLERPAQTMSDVSNFLGLTTYDFTDVVSQGLFNVGKSHDGYDSLSQWNDTLVQEKIKFDLEQVPLSKEVKEEFWNFVNPFTERMAKLTGKRCNDW